MQEKKDLEEIVYVDMPPSDGEAIACGITGENPAERRPIEMTKKEYNSIRNFVLTLGLSILTFAGSLMYADAITQHGSIKKAYTEFMKNNEKANWRALYP